ncbi:MAG: twin-arginine translocase TatA/TatE family subunit [Succinatimonas sp.]|nr:twin-arginine translocase TatA/TatE family subunit [Succinatimonas sp.]
MFGFSLTQLFLVCMVALAVLGPKQTVEVAYSLGRQIGRCKRFFDECKKEIDLQKISANYSSALKEENDEMTLMLKKAMGVNAKSVSDTQRDPLMMTKHSDEQTAEKASDTENLIARIAELECEISALKADVYGRRKIS